MKKMLARKTQKKKETKSDMTSAAEQKMNCMQHSNDRILSY